MIVGAAIAYKVANPALAIPLAFGSHFILDKVPHWNPHTYTETQKYGKPKRTTSVFALVDSTIALFSGFVIASLVLPSLTGFFVIILASFAAVLPDVVKIPFYYYKVRTGFLKRWVNFERSMQVEVKNPVVGMLIQLIIIGAAVLWIAG